MSAAFDTTIAPRPLAGGASRARERDESIDALRGVAILMVIGIHSLPKDDAALVVALDAVLRPCVPVFLFASGYLTARAGDMPLGRRIVRALGPYTVAFVAAYALMAVQNPLMDHRPMVVLARYGLAYVFVYYYVFVYIGCTLLLWLALKASSGGADRRTRLLAILTLAILAGLVAGAYLDPALQRLGVSASTVEEARLRDLPFWFAFMAAGAIIGILDARAQLARWRMPLLAAAVAAYAAYAAVRVLGIGDAAPYDSAAFFAYAVLFCLAGFALPLRAAALSFLGAASYAIYLWHIFAIMLLRPALAPLGQPVAAFVVEYAAALATALLLVVAARRLSAPRAAQWLGA